MALHPSRVSRAVPGDHRCTKRAGRAVARPAQRAIAEPLEYRLVMATSFGVENVLLPKFVAQIGDSDNQLPASDAWWALRSQRNMAINEPVSKVMNFGGHNAFNATMEGFKPIPGLAPNQILSISGQLDAGARLIELDVHDPRELDFSLERNLVLKHGPGPTGLTRNDPYYLDPALAQLRSWLDRPENRNEVIYLDIEDATEQSEAEADDKLIPKLQGRFGSMIYTPAERAADGRWPSRGEMLARGKRVVIFTHRNDASDGRFGAAEMHWDPNGHVWYGASIAFRASTKHDVVSSGGTFVDYDRGNFNQVTVEEVGAVPSEDADSFFAVQSDGIRIPGSPTSRHEASDVRRDARYNVDFIKMDFLFGDDEDALLGSNLGGLDPFYDIPEGDRVELFEAAVWSWAKNDPAVDRQIFQDLVPGDGTGFAMYLSLADRIGFAVANDLDGIAVAARENGRDVAVQNPGGRWQSVEPTSATPYRFAARSVAPVNAAGEYHWVLTTDGSTNWADGHAMVQAEYGAGFVFAGPVNGFQNAQLAAGAAPSPVWMNVHDVDRDGNWQVGAAINFAPAITSVTAQPSSIAEGAAVQLTVEFDDDAADSHQVEIDWGDGSSPTIVQVAAQQEQKLVVSHTYTDDHPASGTASDALGVKVTLLDAGGLSDDATTTVTVNNVAPVIDAIATDASFNDTAAEGEAVNLRATFTDAGVLDTHTAVVNWGDGSAQQVVTVDQATGTITGTHAYLAGGVYTITLSLADDDTGTTTATATAVVSGVGLGNDGTLYVVGGAGGDHVSFHQTPDGRLHVHADLIPDKSRAFGVSGVERIVAYLGGGDDHLTLSNQATVPTVVHGGAGSDHLTAGGGATVLLGDDGDDQLVGHVGRTILIGGAGEDRLVGGKAGAVFIGGSTQIDLDDDALIAAVKAWDAPAAYLPRATTIAAALLVDDDGDEDQLTAGSGQDLFYDGTDDILRGLKADELLLLP